MRTLFSLTLLSALISTAFGADALESKHAVGSDVVIAAIRRVQDTCIFKNDLLFMRRVAFQESNDGNDLTTMWNSKKGMAGIWQNDETELNKLQLPMNYISEQQRYNLSSKLGVNITELDWYSGDLEIPLNAIAVARMWVSLLELNNGPIPYNISNQAVYWETYYKNPNNPATAQDFINNANKMTKCKPPGMDLIFIVDSSGSIGNYDFNLARNFMISVINSSTADSSSNRFGIVRFSDDALQILNLTYSLNDSISAVRNMHYNRGGTNIEAGLNMTSEMFEFDGREEVPKVALLITDGQSNVGGPPKPSAEYLKSLGVNLFTIGVGSEATADLLIWASSPNCMFYYSLEGYNQLATVFPELLNSQICDVSVVASYNQTSLPGTVEKDQALHYQIPASISDGITLKLDILEGAATVYASLTARLPSLSDHDFAANATTENLGQIYISPTQLQQASNNSNFFISDMVALGMADVTVYTSVVGMSDTATNFTLYYEPHDTMIIPTTQKSSAPKLVRSSFLIILLQYFGTLSFKKIYCSCY